MKIQIKNVIVLILLFAAPTAIYANTEVIAQLTKEIAQSKAEDEKSRLHMYRARNYKNMGNVPMAEKDYDAALAYDHKGWIHLERGRFFMASGNYLQAKKEAIAARKETPTLQMESERIIALADKKIKKENNQSNPEQILLTKRWEVTYSRAPSPSSRSRSNVRAAYAEKNKQRTQSRPRRVARS